MPDNHEDIMRSLGKIEGLLTGVAEWRTVVDGRLNVHSDRIRLLERWQSKLLGVAAIVSVPTIVALAVKVLT